MTLQNYWWLLIWLLIFGIASMLINMQHDGTVNGRQRVVWKPLFAIALVLPFVIWAGWRKGFGDTEQYRMTFFALPSSFDQIVPYLQNNVKGPGFRLLEILFKCFFGNADIAFFTIVAIIQMACLVYVYRRYSSDYWLSIFFFVASTDYLSWMHNGIRQFLAATIVFLCVPLIANKRFWLAVLLVLLAVPIHSSVLIFLPFIFIVNGKAWNFRTLLFILVVVLASVFLERATGIITAAMENTEYEGDIEYLLKEDVGTNIFRVLFYSVPAVMSLFFRSYIERAEDPLINVCTNLSIVTAGFYVFSYFTSGVLMGALPIYFSLSNYILIPWLLKEVFEHRTAQILKGVFIVVYVLFFYYQCGITWGIL